MAISSKEHAKSGALHWASKLINTEGQFEKNLESFEAGIQKEVDECKNFVFDSFQVNIKNKILNPLNTIIEKRKAFTAVKKSKDENEIETKRIDAQKAVQDAAGNSGNLNKAISDSLNNVIDMKKILTANIEHLNKLSQYLLSFRAELTRKNDKDAVAYGKNYATEMKN